MTDTDDTDENRGNAAEGDVIAPPDTSGEWLPPALAAGRLGVSERTLWRHVNAGRYHKRVVAGRAEVLVPGETDSLPDTGATDLAAVRRGPDNSVALVVAELQRHLLALEASGEADKARLTRQAEELGSVKAQRDAAEAERARLADELAAIRARGFWARLLNRLQ